MDRAWGGLPEWNEKKKKGGGGCGGRDQKPRVALRQGSGEGRALGQEGVPQGRRGSPGSDPLWCGGKAETVGAASVYFFWCEENNKMPSGELMGCRWRTSGWELGPAEAFELHPAL